MHPIRRYIRKWDQNEGPVLQSWMRQDQLVGGLASLRVGRQISPVVVRFAVGQDRITKGQKVDIQRPHSPALQPFAAKPGLYRMKAGQK